MKHYKFIKNYGYGEIKELSFNLLDNTLICLAYKSQGCEYGSTYLIIDEYSESNEIIFINALGENNVYKFNGLIFSILTSSKLYNEKNYNICHLDYINKKFKDNLTNYYIIHNEQNIHYDLIWSELSKLYVFDINNELNDDNIDNINKLSKKLENTPKSIIDNIHKPIKLVGACDGIYFNTKSIYITSKTFGIRTDIEIRSLFNSWWNYTTSNSQEIKELYSKELGNLINYNG